MMTLWSVGQGISVRVRHWVEVAVKDLIVYQKENFGREINQVYTFRTGSFVSNSGTRPPWHNEFLNLNCEPQSAELALAFPEKWMVIRKPFVPS
jgi:hypothetical protein